MSSVSWSGWDFRKKNRSFKSDVVNKGEDCVWLDRLVDLDRLVEGKELVDDVIEFEKSFLVRQWYEEE